MGPGYFILAIMGCGDGAAMCEEIQRLEPVYRSEYECLADSEAALHAASASPYPMIVAECQQLSPQIAQARLSPEG